MRWTPMIAGTLAVGVGVVSVVQARINAELTGQVNSGIEAAVVSFGGGLVIIAVIVALLPAGRQGVTRLARGVRAPRAFSPWILIGGLGGASFVASQGLVVPAAGVALFSVAVVAGLTGNSLVADKFGVGPGGRVPITAPRVVAALLATAGVALAVVGEISHAGGAAALLLIAFIAGALVAIQQGLNGRVATAAGSPFTAALVNFVVGFTALLVLAALIQQFDGQPWIRPPAPWTAPLLWLGGPAGVAFVVAAAFAVRSLGVLLFSLLTVVGQLAGGVLLDLIVPVSGEAGVAWETWAAVAISIVATVVAFLGTRSRKVTSNA